MSEALYSNTNIHPGSLPVALITGASRGIGRAIAKKFAQEGYELYLTCNNSFPELEALSRTLADNYHVPCHAYRTDMGDAASVEQLFTHISRLDVLVNNAGITKDVIIAGVQRRVEIWDAQRWQEYNDSVTEEDICEIMEEENI